MAKKILKEILKRILFYSCFLLIVYFLLRITFWFSYESTWSNFIQFDTQNGRYAVVILKNCKPLALYVYEVRIICRDYQTGKEVKYADTRYDKPRRPKGNEGYKFQEINADEAELIITDCNCEETFEFVWADIFD